MTKQRITVRTREESIRVALEMARDGCANPIHLEQAMLYYSDFSEELEQLRSVQAYQTQWNNCKNCGSIATGRAHE